MKGYFIVLEGGEGSGKGTLADYLLKKLSNIGKEIIRTREPGGTPLAEEIREMVLRHRDEAVDPITELLLMNASRRQHYVNVIKPAIERGAIVISERFIDSSYALQCCGGKISREDFERVREVTIGAFRPDLTVVLDVDPAYAFSRLAYRGKLDRLESMGISYHREVRKAFLECAEVAPDRYLVLEALQDLGEMTTKIINAIK